MEATPKYRIMAKLSPDAMPHTQLWADEVVDRSIAANRLAEEYPDSIIQVRLMKGFRHRKPMRWERESNGKLVVAAYYDKNATGKTAVNDCNTG